MHKRLSLIPVAGLALLTLAGCGSTPASAGGSTSNPASSSTTQPSSPSANSQLSASLATRMKNVAGISDPAAFVQGFNQLKADVAQGNEAKVAAFVTYPLNVYAGGNQQTITNAQAFVQQYHTIMTSKVKAAIAAQQVNQLFVNDEGVMVGSGEVWLSQSGRRDCTIITINH